MTFTDRKLERNLAVSAFIVAAALAFTALLRSETNEIAAGVQFIIAQFLVFAGSILGIDYKFNSHDNTAKSHQK